MTGTRTIRIVCVHQGVELYGSDRSFLQALQALRAAWPTARIKVVLPGVGPLNAHVARIADEVDVRSLCILRLAEPAKTLAKTTLALPWYLTRAAADVVRADLVYVNTAVVADYMLAVRLAPAKSIIHVREIPKPKAMPVIAQLCMAGGAGLIYNSAATAQTFAGVPARRVAVVHNGVDPVQGAAPPDVPAQFSADRPLRIAMLGRISDWKGQDVLVDALGALSPADRARVKLRFVGGTFKEAQAPVEALRARVAQHGLEDAVSIEGFADDPSEAYRWAYIIAVPSKLPEPFGRVAIEAMAEMRPPVVAAHGGLVEIVDAATGWLFKPGDPADLAACLRAAIADPESIRAKAIAAHDRFTDKFTTGAMQRSLIGKIREWVPAFSDGR